MVHQTRSLNIPPLVLFLFSAAIFLIDVPHDTNVGEGNSAHNTSSNHLGLLWICIGCCTGMEMGGWDVYRSTRTDIFHEPIPARISLFLFV